MEEYETQAQQPKPEVIPVQETPHTESFTDAEQLANKLTALVSINADQAMRDLAQLDKKDPTPVTQVVGPIKIEDTSKNDKQQPLAPQTPDQSVKHTLLDDALKQNTNIPPNTTPHDDGTQGAQLVLEKVTKPMINITEYLAQKANSSQSNKPSQPEKVTIPTPIIPSAPEPLAA